MIDKLLNKMVSRKLAVWAASSAFLFGGMISGSEWVTLSIIYLGSQAVIDGVASRKFSKEIDSASS